MILLLIAYVVAFAVVDRIWGGDVKHGRRYSILIALAAGLGLGWWRDGLIGLEAGAVMSVAFLLTRSLGFHAFGGSSTPRKGGQLLGLVVRHAILTVPAGVATAVLLTHGPVWRPAAAFGLWALLAGVLGLMYGEANARAKHDGRPIAPILNQLLELIRGAAFGCAMVLA